MNAREAAYHALLSSMREEQFISSYLENWQQTDFPSKRDYRFAHKLAYGTMRLQKTLDHYAKQLTDTLKLKRKERVLLYLALYQALIMDKVPIHAVVNESVELAKKECHRLFANFLNAILKKIPDAKLTLPKDNDAKNLSIRYSYTEYYTEELLAQYDLKKTLAILEAGNSPGKTMGRIRNNFETLTTIIQDPFKVAVLDHPHEYTTSTGIYIQNATPAHLMGELAKNIKIEPKSILDLCASPGGKALMAHDLYPKAKLTVNDISETKISKIKENFEKYHIEANYSVSLGENFSSEKKFDLIILDVPCSNSGVLNKRPEARWRINSCSVKELQSMQKKLLRHALTLLAPGGEIWYMTCSILKTENENLIKEEGLWEKCLCHKVILPNKEGWDGGFACSIKDLS